MPMLMGIVRSLRVRGSARVARRRSVRRPRRRPGPAHVVAAGDVVPLEAAKLARRQLRRRRGRKGERERGLRACDDGDELVRRAPDRTRGRVRDVARGPGGARGREGVVIRVRGVLRRRAPGWRRGRGRRRRGGRGSAGSVDGGRTRVGSLSGVDDRRGRSSSSPGRRMRIGRRAWTRLRRRDRRKRWGNPGGTSCADGRARTVARWLWLSARDMLSGRMEAEGCCGLGWGNDPRKRSSAAAVAQSSFRLGSPFSTEDSRDADRFKEPMLEVVADRAGGMVCGGQGEGGRFGGKGRDQGRGDYIGVWQAWRWQRFGGADIRSRPGQAPRGNINDAGRGQFGNRQRFARPRSSRSLPARARVRAS
ncbi:hypothetical protein C8Q79DRAFT_449023 [Trametes meyenii]|nr:hypothetical protein C8Q79DRAFT_449023 [Trametes meyenii]